MKKIYEEPEFDIEKFQFLNVLGPSQDDPWQGEVDPDFPDDPDEPFA